MLLLLLPASVLLLSCRMDLLEVAMRKLLKNVVPADLYAARLVAVCLRPHLPRCVCVCYCCCGGFGGLYSFFEHLLCVTRVQVLGGALCWH